MAGKSLIGMIRDSLLGEPAIETAGPVQVMPAQPQQPQPQTGQPLLDKYAEQGMALEAQDNLDKDTLDYELADFAIDANKVKEFGVSQQELNEGLQAYKGVAHGAKVYADIENDKQNGLDTTEKESFFEQLADGAKKMFGSEEKMLSLALAFNTMRMNPDQGLASHLSGRLKTINENKVTKVEAQRTVQQLMSMGETEAAKIVMANPDMAKEVLKQIVQKKYAKGASPTISGVQIDPSTGQQYVVRTDPATGVSKRVNVEGAKGETPQQKAQRENEQKERQFGVEQAQKRSQEVMTSISNIDSQINNLQSIVTALDEGADTGIIRNLLPAFDTATSSLRQAANRLGIDIINSVTFGALSEQELKLALSIPIDTSLPPDQLRQQVEQKLAAQAKLRQALVDEALYLSSSGVTYKDYMTQKLNKQNQYKQESSTPSSGFRIVGKR
jgi:hypothetical protein